MDPTWSCGDHMLLGLCCCCCCCCCCRFLHKLLAPWTALLYTMLLPVLPSDPVNSVKASPNECVGPRQWLALHLPLPQVHASAKALGHTVNAMAAACLAGGVRRYLDARGEGVPSSIRICSMVDTRAMGAKVTGLTAGASNNFSFIAVPLPTDPATAPAQRVHGAAAALNWIRHSLAVPLAVRIPSLVQVRGKGGGRQVSSECAGNVMIQQAPGGVASGVRSRLCVCSCLLPAAYPQRPAWSLCNLQHLPTSWQHPGTNKKSIKI
jgi:hypothetical protein